MIKTEGWKTLKYSLNSWLSHKFIILRFLPTIWFLQKVIKAQNRQFKLVWHLWTGRLVLQQSLQNNIVQPIHRQHNWAPNCIQCLYILVWKVFEYDYKYHLIDFPDLIIFWNIIEHIPCQHNRAHVIALDTDVSSF